MEVVHSDALHPDLLSVIQTLPVNIIMHVAYIYYSILCPRLLSATLDSRKYVQCFLMSGVLPPAEGCRVPQ